MTFNNLGLCVQSPSIIPVPGYPLCILGQVWYLIVSIPDLCNLITLVSFCFGLMLYIPVNSSVHVGSVSSHSHIFPGQV